MASVLTAFSAANESGTLSSSWVAVVSIGGGSLISGHEYLVLANISLAGGFGTFNKAVRARVVINSGAVIDSEEAVQTENNANFHRYFSISKFVYGGAGNVDLEAMKDSGANPSAWTSACLVVIDLDSNHYALPPNDVSGWQWTENTTPLIATDIPTPHGTHIFTPDGSSDYLVIATSRFTGFSSSNEIARMGLEIGGDTTTNHERKGTTSTALAEYIFNAAQYLGAPGATPLTIQTMISSSGTSTCVNSTIFIIRLSAATAFGLGYTEGPVQYGDTEQHTLVQTNINETTALSVLAFERVENSAWTMNSSTYSERLKQAGVQRHLTPNLSCRPSVNNLEGSVFVDLIPTIGGAQTYSTTVQNAVGDATYRRALILALQMEVSGDPTATSNLSLGATAQPIRERATSASSSTSLDAIANAKLNTNTSASASCSSGASAQSSVIRTAMASASAVSYATAAAIVATHRYLEMPSVERSFSSGELQPDDMAECSMSGDDLVAHGILNRLVAVSNHRLGVDSDYTPTDGIPYIFEGPPTVGPPTHKLGFKRGDKIHLLQADEQPVGLNNNRTFTIDNPGSLAMMEAVVYPDVPVGVPYKFRAIKRGI
jgi:hypothetical protein